MSNSGPLPKGWVEYYDESPLGKWGEPPVTAPRLVRCPIGAAPAWVQRKHAGERS